MVADGLIQTCSLARITQPSSLSSTHDFNQISLGMDDNHKDDFLPLPRVIKDTFVVIAEVGSLARQKGQGPIFVHKLFKKISCLRSDMQLAIDFSLSRVVKDCEWSLEVE